MIELLIAGIILGLLPAAIARARGLDFFTWWVYGVFIFPVALVHAFFAGPNSFRIVGPAKGTPSAANDLRERLDSWHAEHDRPRAKRR